MERETIELIGSPGIIRDTPAHKLNPAAFNDGQNMLVDESGAEAIVGDLATFSTGSVDPILWLQFFPPITNPVWTYANLTAVHTVNGTTHTDITRASGVYAAIAGERWNAAILNGIGVLNNTIDIPQSWSPISASTLLIDLPNWTSTRRCKSLRSFKNYLVALYMTDSGKERPYRILWSDSADAGTVPGSWDSTDPATDSREFDLAETSDYLVDQLSMGDINIIYKENSTWGMQYIGPPFYFRFWKILSKNGLLHRDCVVNAPFGHCAVTQDDIIVHSGQVEQFTSILDRSMKKWIFSNIDTTNFKNSFLFSNPANDCIYFCFPQTGATYANTAVIWNYSDKSIGVQDLASTPFIAVGPIGSAIDDDPEWGV